VANNEQQLRQLDPQLLLELLIDDQLLVEKKEGRIYEDFLDWCAHNAESFGPVKKKEIMVKLLHHQRLELFLIIPYQN
jgi:hypothetical protein